MKLIEGIVFILALVVTNVVAQTGKHGVKIGLQAGICFADIRIKESISQPVPDEYNFKPMYSISAYFLMKSKNRLGVSVEPGFIRKGSDAKVSYDLSNITRDVDYQLDYVTLPALVNFSLSQKLTIGAGAAADFLIKAETKYKNEPVVDDTKFYKEMDLALLAGLDYRILKFVDMAFRYSYSLSPSREWKLTDSVGDNLGDMKLYNQVFQLAMQVNLKNLNDN